MDVVCVSPLLLLVLCGVLSNGLSSNISSRPAVVNIGAVFTFDSTIGKASYFAIKEAVNDVNSNLSVLHGTKLQVELHNSNCSGFHGIIGGTLYAIIHDNFVTKIMFKRAVVKLTIFGSHNFRRAWNNCSYFHLLFIDAMTCSLVSATIQLLIFPFVAYSCTIHGGRHSCCYRPTIF